MTGPGEGKIPLVSQIFMVARGVKVELPCDVYLHVKGYSRARVTHIDLEAGELNELLAPGFSQYLYFIAEGDELRIELGRVLYLKSLKIPVREIVIRSPTLARSIGPRRDVVYIGGKPGGVYLGFRREVVRRLEELAIEMGVPPRKRR
ncbi:MAG: hypothetical protein DRJ43_00910 [Thermoprotei archaeon]|nr:MAG: hypothetical protein DRJ43_00910 [Thermoprotei archaeon]